MRMPPGTLTSDFAMKIYALEILFPVNETSDVLIRSQPMALESWRLREIPGADLTKGPVSSMLINFKS